jgi:hypothetical protein
MGGNVECRGEARSIYRILAGKPEILRSPEMPGYNWKDNIKFWELPEYLSVWRLLKKDSAP